MLAALTAEGLGRLRRLTVAYSIRGFEPTRHIFPEERLPWLHLTDGAQR